MDTSDELDGLDVTGDGPFLPGPGPDVGSEEEKTTEGVMSGGRRYG